MIERTQAASTASLPWAQGSDPASARKVLRMTQNERTAGSIPAWVRAQTPAQDIEHALSLAATDGLPPPGNALAYNPQDSGAHGGGEFGFLDLLDMVNPLHHIPVVGHVYREITGDTIRPIGQVIGGAVFGGALGAAGGLVNVIVQEETGQDITGNAISLALNGEISSARPAPVHADDPQQRLDAAARYAAHGQALPDLPGALLAFTDLRHDAGIVIEKTGHEDREKDADPLRHSLTGHLPAREPITEIAIPPLPSELY